VKHTNMIELKPVAALISVLFTLAVSAGSQAGQKAEVLHWWVSGGETAALQVIMDEFEKRGHTFVDTPVEASYHAKSAAMSRSFAGNPPCAVQWHTGVNVKDLYENGLLQPLNGMMEARGWKKVLPELIWRHASVNNHLVVLPLTVHGTNWTWASKKVLDACGLSMPKTWDGFKRALSVVKKRGFIPLAMGGHSWHKTALLTNLVLARGGANLYLNVFIRHDPKAMTSPAMVKVLSEFHSFKQYVGKRCHGCTWDQATKLVINHQAAFQIMGDWAKSEFLQAKRTLDNDFYGSLTPGTSPYLVTVSDCIAMMVLKSPKDKLAQEELARVIMDPEVQRRFNLLKGSIPPRVDVSSNGFDKLSLLAMETMRGKNNLLPGLTMGNREFICNIINDIVDDFWHSDNPDPVRAAQQLAKAIAQAES
jgi:glucose/mannose transport system substrate-binding protein